MNSLPAFARRQRNGFPGLGIGFGLRPFIWLTRISSVGTLPNLTPGRLRFPF